MSRVHWLCTELAVLRREYPQIGAKACADLLPGRTPNAIHQYAKKLGITRIPSSAPEATRIRNFYRRQRAAAAASATVPA